MTNTQQHEFATSRVIEEDHALFRELIGRLQETLNAGRSVDEIERRQAALVAHLDAHMGFEEQSMVERGYPLAFTHAQAHKGFRDQVTTVLDGVKSGTLASASLGRVLLRIHDHHLKHHDVIFCRYLADRYSLQEVAEGTGI